jgi:capsular exopolysaccharide synthesis family protein
MTSQGKGGSYYGYGRSGKKKAGAYAAGKPQPKQPSLLGNGISFTASEAYKLLRTKLQFSFADDNNCRIIGLSSAFSGEGKSLSAINLAYTLSQLNKRVLLIDCDMRRPSLDVKLPVSRKPGLSGFLSGQNNLENLIQLCGLREDENAFHVISAGQNPPNPVELLSSARMVKMLAKLRTVYDYVILDLPPIGEVSDALAVSKETDGILLVVRQHYCNRPALSAAVRQFEFVESRLLGIVYNCTAEESAGYGKKYYNKKYYKKYDQRSEGRFSAASKE